MALRYRVGIDTLNYMRNFEWVLPIERTSLFEIFSQFEPLNVLLRSIAKSFSDDFVFFQILHVFILNTLIARFILRHTQHILFALFFYFLLAGLYFNTEILRESLAVAVFINAFDYLKQKQWLKYYLCTAIAIGFHTSASLTLLIPLVYKIQLNRFFWFVSGVFLVLLFVFQSQLHFIAIFFESTAGDKIIGYLNQDRLNINWMIVQVLNTAAFPIFFLYLNRKTLGKSENENMVGFYIVMGLGTIPVQMIFSRFTNYFVFFYIVMLANLIPLIKTSIFRLIATPSLCLYFAVILYLGYFRRVSSVNEMKVYSRWYPYHSVFNKVKDPIREANWSGN